MDAWEKVLRDGFLPGMSRTAKEALLEACLSDDPRLTQGSTTTPPPLMCVQDWPCEGACAVGFAGWQGDGIEAVGGVEEYFARQCHDADRRLGEPAACRYFLNWFDDSPRGDALAAVAAVVRDVLAAEEKAVAA